MASRSRTGAIAYWTVVVFLMAFGFLGLFSIGMPFLLLGITLAILWPRRHAAGVIASGIAGIVGLTLGYTLVAPISCTGTESPIDPVGHTVCSNILGIDYSGTGVYNPSLLPGLVAGLVMAVLFAIATRWLVRRSAARRATPTVPVST